MRKSAASFAVAGAIGLAASFAAIGSPAEAQSQRIAEIIVYGDDPCPRSTDDEIVVCARKPEADRYRIPEDLRTGGARQTREAWVNRARSLETVSDTGIMSCSPVGPAGFTGCLEQLIGRNATQSGEAAASSTPPEQ